MFSLLLYGSIAFGSDECETLYRADGCEVCVTHFADRQCGYCKANNKCISYSNSSSCPSDQFYYGPDASCSAVTPAPFVPPSTPTPTPVPIPGTQCSLFTSCDECTGHLGDRNCGWCEVSKTCEPAETTTCNSSAFYYNNNAKCGAVIPTPTPTPYPRYEGDPDYCKQFSGTWCTKCVQPDHMCVWDFDTKECAMGDKLGFFVLPGKHYSYEIDNRCKGKASKGVIIGLQVGLGIFITAITIGGICLCYFCIRKGESEHDGYEAK